MAIKGKIVEIAKSHKGSLQLQNILKRTSVSNIGVIIEECKHSFGDLMMDSYGNYFC